MVLAAGVVALGLASRAYAIFPASWGKYPGDALWAAMMLLLLAAAWPRARMKTPAIGALAIAFAVEFSQLYHAPWIDAIRATIPGRLVLGNTFNWPDLPAYAVGVALGALAEWRLRD